MVQPTYDYRIDWDNDGDFTTLGDDITPRVLNRTPVSIAYGRDQARSLSPVTPGRVQAIEVDNRSRDYSPENATSPLAGKLLPGRPIQIAATYGTLNTNSGFGAGVGGWSPSGSGSFTSSTAFAYKGSMSARMAPTGTTGSYTTQITPSLAPTATAGTSYAASVWLYSPAGYGSVQLSLCWINSSNTVMSLTSTAVTAVPAGTWTRLKVTGTAPANTTRVGMRVGMSSIPNPSTDLLYLDEARVTLAGDPADPHVMFRGFLDGYDLVPDPQIRSVTFSALDALARLSGVPISTPLYRGIRTGTAIDNLLDAVGWPDADRDLDVGATALPYWWAEGDAWDALNNLLLAEGPSAMAYVSADGKFVFRDRHHRLIRTASTTAQATFRDTGTEPLFSTPMAYDAGWRDIQNAITINVEQRAASPTSQIVWQSDQWYGVASGATLDIEAVTSDPFLDATVETTTGSGDGYAVISRTSGQSTIITLQNPTGATLTYRSVQLRARPVTVTRTQQVTAEDTDSITEYGRRTPGQSIPWVGLGDAQAIAALIIAQRAQRVPAVSLRMVSANTTRLTQQLTRDLSDRVHVTDGETGLDADCFIEQIQHTLDPAHRVLETVFGMEKVAGQLDDPTTILILGSATQGVLGTNVLAH